jgi:hypothetical protein
MLSEPENELKVLNKEATELELMEQEEAYSDKASTQITGEGVTHGRAIEGQPLLLLPYSCSDRVGGSCINKLLVFTTNEQ